MNFKALVGTRGGMVKRFLVQRGRKELRPFKENHTAPVTSLAGFKNGQYGVSLSIKNGEMRVWDFEHPESCLHQEFVQDAVCVTTTIDEQSVLIGCKNTLRRLTMGDCAGETTTLSECLISDLGAKENGGLQVCKTLSANEVVIILGWRHVSVWDTVLKKRVVSWRCSEKTKSPASFALNRKFNVCVLGCVGGIVEIRDVYSGKLYKRLTNSRISKSMSFTHVGIDEDGDVIIAGSGMLLFKFNKPYKSTSALTEVLMPKVK